MTKPTDFNDIETEIRKILWKEWDPIGCGIPEDEYDSYVPRIHALLEEGADVSYIAYTLEHIATKWMGLGSDLAKDFVIATKIYEMYVFKTGGAKTSTKIQVVDGKPVEVKE